MGIEADAVLGHLAFGHLLKEEPRSVSVRVLDGDLVLRPPSATPVAPRTRPTRRAGQRGLAGVDVAQHVAPERRQCSWAVSIEGDLNISAHRTLLLLVVSAVHDCRSQPTDVSRWVRRYRARRDRGLSSWRVLQSFAYRCPVPLTPSSRRRWPLPPGYAGDRRSPGGGSATLSVQLEEGSAGRQWAVRGGTDTGWGQRTIQH